MLGGLYGDLPPPSSSVNDGKPTNATTANVVQQCSSAAVHFATTGGGGGSAPPPRSPSPPSGKMTAGERMMAKMGWKEGQGLGKLGQGITTPLTAKKTYKRVAAYRGHDPR